MKPMQIAVAGTNMQVTYCPTLTSGTQGLGAQPLNSKSVLMIWIFGKYFVSLRSRYESTNNQ